MSRVMKRINKSGAKREKKVAWLGTTERGGAGTQPSPPTAYSSPIRKY